MNNTLINGKKDRKNISDKKQGFEVFVLYLEDIRKLLRIYITHRPYCI